ncbi:MAG: cupin domain-containing protein [Candidatus Micrarchaeota archaeon]
MKKWMEKLKKEGFSEIRVCPLPPDADAPEHTHDRHTVHVILSGELTITGKSGTKTYKRGDRVEFPAGTTHKARGGKGEMVVGVRADPPTFEARYISVTINRTASQVYEFASKPENLPTWASGLSSSVKKVDGELVAESPMGQIRIKFAERNGLGVLDHDVTLPSGEKVYNPMRVFPNGSGCELVFTVYKRPGMSGKMFADDAKTVKRDLQRLKALLEGG